MTMTTKELLALVDKWRSQADSAMRSSGTWSGDQMADRVAYMADELAPIATALCAEVEVLRKDAERWRAYERELPHSADSTRVFLHGVAILKAAKLAAKEPTK